VAVEPGGVGINFAPGQLLDPINDLVEQFATWMLLASIAFGVQKVMISIGSYWLISAVLTLGTIFWLWLRMREQRCPTWLSKALVMLVLIRFAVPVVTVGSDWLFQRFMSADYANSQKTINTASTDFGKLQASDSNIVDRDAGLLDRLKGWMDKKMQVSVRFENLKRAAEQSTEDIIKLIVIFFLQTLLIPLLLLWGFFHFVKGLFPREAA
jgi:hypothetical protein